MTEKSVHMFMIVCLEFLRPFASSVDLTVTIVLNSFHFAQAIFSFLSSTVVKKKSHTLYVAVAKYTKVV